MHFHLHSFLRMYLKVKLHVSLPVPKFLLFNNKTAHCEILELSGSVFLGCALANMQLSAQSGQSWSALSEPSLVSHAGKLLNHTVKLLSIFVHIIEHREPEPKESRVRTHVYWCTVNHTLPVQWCLLWISKLTGKCYVDNPRMSTMPQTPCMHIHVCQGCPCPKLPVLNIHVCQGCPPCPNPLCEYLYVLRIIRQSTMPWTSCLSICVCQGYPDHLEAPYYPDHLDQS